ncbi:MAG: hypothetical protein AAGF66_15715 [Cyanobacteria bacterium P01_H01_bin.119]
MTQFHSFKPYPPQSRAESGGMGKAFLLGGIVCTLVALVVDFQGVRGMLFRSQTATVTGDRCASLQKADATLSREKLAQVLAIPERDSKAKVQEIVGEPYCTLPELKVRSGVSANREAYPLAFDPKTQLVILYENDEYAGYRFHFE